MKTMYQQPTITVTKIETRSLLGGVSANPDGSVKSVSLSDIEYTGDASGILSRNGGLWDDDED